NAMERAAARTRFGLPANAPLALLVAGSWGVGPVRQVARELRDCGAAVPVVVCGRNEALAEQLRADGVEHVHGWVDDMPGLMHAADVLVQNAGGLTSLEAFAAGLPVASYGCIPGHGLTNASALDQAGVAAWIRDPTQLKHVLGELIDGPRGLLQREAGLALFAGGASAELPGRGPDPAAGKNRGTVTDESRSTGTGESHSTGTGESHSTGAWECRGTVADESRATVSGENGGTGVHQGPAMDADRGPAAETVRICRAGVGPATPIAVRRTRAVRPTALRLATTTALACAVWA
ncbi:glycosyltransferase, partial [Streptomyces sp. W16]|uniref:glycosyltransferase n=1 Tax=Streptomyces sp. W16 TaxID=3076631 RepID=UPI00295BDA89